MGQRTPTAELVERIWERDPTVWTGTDDHGRAVRPGMYYARLTTPDGRFTRAFARVE